MGLRKEKKIGFNIDIVHQKVYSIKYTVNYMIMFSMTCILCNASFNVHHEEIGIQIRITSRNTHIITYHHTNTANLPFSTHFHHLRMNCHAVHLSCYWPQDWCEVPCQRRH